MKKLLIFLGLGFFGLQCTKTEIVTALTLPCDCKDLPMIYEYKGLKGTFFFSRKPSEPYSIIGPRLGGVEISNFFGICSDSVSMSLIKTQKITDSTTVIFDGGLIDREVDCNKHIAIRITNLTKSPQ